MAESRGWLRRRLPDGPNAVLASSARISLGDRRALAKQLAKPAGWQDEAWDYYDTIGEVKYGVGFLANAMSRLRLYVAEQPDPAEPPVPVEDSQAEDAMSRLGSLGEHMRRLAVNLSVPGECYLVGLTDDDGGETWAVRSTSEVQLKGDTVTLRESPKDQNGRPLGEEDFLLRIWLPHPRWTNLADSNLRGVLASCEELLIWERALRAMGKSRTFAGLLLVPDELSFGTMDPTTDGAGDGEDEDDPFFAGLMEAMKLPLQDEGSSSAVVPPVVHGKGEYLDMLRHVIIDRPIDRQILERLQSAIRRIAQGMNVPPEVVLGLADVNHWTGWMVDDSTVKAHVDPLAERIVNALTVGYLRPVLEEGGHPDPASRLVWYDPSALVTNPDRLADVIEAYDRMEASGAALRGAANISDEDAPSPEEIEERLRRAGAIRVAREQGSEGGPPPEPAAVTASHGAMLSAGSTVQRRLVRPAGDGKLGRRLAELDRILQERLLAAADVSMGRTLERAGARIRSKAQRDPVARQVVANVAVADAARTLGPTGVRQLGLTEDDLLDGAFDDLAARFEHWVGLGQQQLLFHVEGLSAETRAHEERQATMNRQDGWVWLASQLRTLAAEAMFDSAAAGDDPMVPIPRELIRDALRIAGGGRVPAAVR